MNGVFAELGNVLTRVTVRGDPSRERGVRFEESVPTTIHPPYGSAAEGLETVLEAAEGRMPDEGPRVALLHLGGAPRTAVFGPSGLATTELSIQAALRRGGSSVTQMRVSDTAVLEGQLIEVRGQPLDLLIFTGTGHQAAERLMAGGGPTPRVLRALAAVYNGPKGDISDLIGSLGSGVDFIQIPPLRTDAGGIEPVPTEEEVSRITGLILAEDPQLEPARKRGFKVATFGAALTLGLEGLAGLWRDQRPGEPGARGSQAGTAYAHVGGRYAELAVTAGSRALRHTADLWTGAPESPQAAKGPKDGSPTTGSGTPLDTAAIGRWLPQGMPDATLAELLANYRRRLFLFPSTWQQVLLLAALARERLAGARAAFRVPLVSGDWRSGTTAYVVGGGHFRHLPGPGLALAIALDGLEPIGVSEVLCDLCDLVPFAGALHDPAAGLAGFDRDLARLATVVAPVRLVLDWRRPHEDDLMAVVTVRRSDGKETTFRVVPGSLIRFPLRPGEAAELDISPLRDHDFGAGQGRPWRGTVTGGRLGLVFDARGRPIALPADPEVRQSKLREWLKTLDAAATWEAQR